MKNRFITPSIGFIIMFANSLSLIAQPIKVLSLGLRIEYLGIFPAFGFSIQMFFRPLFSSFADKYGRKIIVILGTLLISVGLFIFWISENIILLIIAYIISSQGFGIIWSPLTVISAESYHRSSKGIGIVQSSAMIGNFFGTLISGFSFKLLGVDTTLFISALFSFLSLIASLMLEETISFKEKGVISGMKISFKISLPVFFSISSLGMRPVIRIYGSVLLMLAGIQPEIVGLIMMIDPLITAISQFFSERLYIAGFRRTEILNSIAIIFAILFIFSALKNPIIAILTLALYSITSAMIITIKQSMLVESTKQSTSKMAGYDLALSFSKIFNSIIVPSVASYSNIFTGFMFSGIVLLFLSTLFGVTHGYEYLKGETQKSI